MGPPTQWETSLNIQEKPQKGTPPPLDLNASLQEILKESRSPLDLHASLQEILKESRSIECRMQQIQNKFTEIKTNEAIINSTVRLTTTIPTVSPNQEASNKDRMDDDEHQKATTQ